MISNVLNPTNNPDNIHIHLEEKVEGEKKQLKAEGFLVFVAMGFSERQVCHTQDTETLNHPLSLLMLICERFMSLHPCKKKKKESLRHSQERLFLSMFHFHRDSAQWSMPCPPALAGKPVVGARPWSWKRGDSTKRCCPY